MRVKNQIPTPPAIRVAIPIPAQVRGSNPFDEESVSFGVVVGCSVGVKSIVVPNVGDDHGVGVGQMPVHVGDGVGVGHVPVHVGDGVSVETGVYVGVPVGVSDGDEVGAAGGGCGGGGDVTPDDGVGVCVGDGGGGLPTVTLPLYTSTGTDLPAPSPTTTLDRVSGDIPSVSSAVKLIVTNVPESETVHP